MKYFLYQCIVLVPMYCMALDEINAMSRRNAMKYFMRIFSSGAVLSAKVVYDMHCNALEHQVQTFLLMPEVSLSRD